MDPSYGKTLHADPGTHIPQTGTQSGFSTSGKCPVVFAS